MSLTILKVTPTNIEVRIETIRPALTETWNVDRRGQERCSIGSFRTKDGGDMQPDYRRLRSLVS